jgi:hypothetical protein
VHDNRAPTFVLPQADLTLAKLQQAEVRDDAPAAPRRVPSWLPVGTPLPTPNRVLLWALLKWLWALLKWLWALHGSTVQNCTTEVGKLQSLVLNITY